MSTMPRKTKKLLSGEQKYDLWLRMLTDQITTAQAAAEADVDRSTIMTVRKVASDAAVAALSAHPGQRKVDRVEQAEIVRLQRKVDRLTTTIVEQADELAVLRGKPSGVEWPDSSACPSCRGRSTHRPH